MVQSLLLKTELDRLDRGRCVYREVLALVRLDQSHQYIQAVPLRRFFFRTPNALNLM